MVKPLILFARVKQDSNTTFVMNPAEGNLLYVNDGTHNFPSMMYAEVILLIPVEKHHRGVCMTVLSNGDFGIFYKEDDKIRDPEYNGTNSFLILAMSDIKSFDSTWNNLRKHFDAKIQEFIEYQKDKMPDEFEEIANKIGFTDEKMKGIIKEKVFGLPKEFDEEYFGIKSIETKKEAQSILDKYQAKDPSMRSSFSVDKRKGKSMEPGAANGDEIFQPKHEEGLNDFLQNIKKKEKDLIDDIDIESLESVIFEGLDVDPKQKEIFKRMVSPEVMDILVDFMKKFMSLTEDMDGTPEEFLSNPLNALRLSKIIIKCTNDIVHDEE